MVGLMVGVVYISLAPCYGDSRKLKIKLKIHSLMKVLSVVYVIKVLSRVQWGWISCFTRFSFWRKCLLLQLMHMIWQTIKPNVASQVKMAWGTTLWEEEEKRGEREDTNFKLLIPVFLFPATIYSPIHDGRQCKWTFCLNYRTSSSSFLKIWTHKCSPTTGIPVMRLSRDQAGTKVYGRAPIVTHWG